VKSLKDLAPHRLEEIAEFFRTYKNLEKKVTEIRGWQDVEQVLPLVEKCIKAGREKTT
jgi:inorganic pyrophosphatase